MLRLRNIKVEGTACVLLLLTVGQFLPLLGFALSNDASALLQFMRELNKDPHRTITNSWNESNVDAQGCPFGWYGVFCSNGTVHGLMLENLGLVGVIKPGSLGRLSGLTYLSLSNNAFVGAIPDDLGTLSFLEQLHLRNNRLNGSIPVSFGALFNLANFSLAENDLSGPIPECFGNMSFLVDLDLSSNGFSGSIPSTLVQLQHLYSLNLSHNNLSDSSTFKMDKLHNLEILDFHQNQLSGQINPEWFNFNKIQMVDLSANQFSGFLPWQQAAPIFSNMVYLNLSSNQLSGTLGQKYSPSLFANNLQVLDLSSNNISGELPSFNFAYSLRVLRLNDNFFSGSIPSFLFSDKAKFLEKLDLSRNNFSGSVDEISAARLKFINFSSNMLSGTIPTRLGNSTTVVDLSNNLLSGNLSGIQEWGYKLEVLDLSSNGLTGLLPTQTTELTKLLYFNLSHNALSGFLPLSFSVFYRLTKLDLSANNLFGTIPSFLFNLPALTELQLSNNLFTGRIVIEGSHISGIPSSQIPTPKVSQPPISYSSSLSVLDLSFNSLNGSIPEGIGSLGTLRVLNLRHNMLSGLLSSRMGNLTKLQYLDVSFNEFSGAIPSELPSSVHTLNVSYNKFSGVAPLNLACKFPYSTFFPGNPQLKVPASSQCHVSPGSSSIGSKGHHFWHRHKRGMNSMVKAGLIGSCTAVALLLIAAGLIIHYKRISSKFQEVPQSPEFHAIGQRFAWYKSKGSHPPKANLSYQAREELAHPISGEAIPIEHPVAPSNGNGFHDALDSVNEDESDIMDDISCELVDPMRTKSFSISPSGRHKGTSAQFPPTVELPSADYDAQLQQGLTGDPIIFDKTMMLTAEELSKAPAEVVGRSGHGITYKATLSSGQILAVKWLRDEVTNSRKEFVTEARKFGNFKHPNVLQVRGCYWGPGEHEKLILSNFISSGSLSAHLSGRMGESLPLSWSQRICIAVDIASGLTYFHLEQRLPHGNLKANNVLLDGPEFDGQLADYGLHRLLTSAGTSNQLLNARALGYLAPELVGAKKPKPTFSADVYAFGVILMELLTGKCAADIILGSSGVVDLPDWVSLLASEGRSLECFDQSLVGHEREQEVPNGIRQVLSIALRCISPCSTRPNMKTVYEDLVAVIPS
ncbi:hypothetical protein O6H91_03G115000 [Diphasiastrum complanatum]|uniref:Uncharacterized protein n=2 Tax=Diphasiastrum complanatum TaxID=34168 RepID=A0ACC2EB79_DIPCM|nr:hypothetical protein O6H91_03G115000 [Diphasiastrum complanatum]KAJ7563553.1 hypothetical protein O6H91_03G115000 [Diphasiastrum complanatum]